MKANGVLLFACLIVWKWDYFIWEAKFKLDRYRRGYE